MNVVEHIELETLNPLVNGCSEYFGYEKYQLEPNDLQKHEHIWAASTNKDIENCIIRKPTVGKLLMMIQDRMRTFFQFALTIPRLPKPRRPYSSF